MATVTGIRKGLSVYYVEHNELQWKIAELKNGAYEVFYMLMVIRIFLEEVHLVNTNLIKYLKVLAKVLSILKIKT